MEIRVVVVVLAFEDIAIVVDLQSAHDWLEIRAVGCSSKIKIVVDLHHGRQRWRTSHSLSLCYACPGDVGGDNDGDNALLFMMVLYILG